MFAVTAPKPENRRIAALTCAPTMDYWTPALAAYEQGHAAEATRLLDQHLAAQPDDAQAHHLYGVIAVDRGDYPAAVAHLDTACQLDANNDMAWSNLGNAQRLAGHLAEADAALRRGLALNPGNANLHFNLGLVLCDLARDHDAENAFHQACTLAPEDGAAWFQIGRLRFLRADFVNAADALLRAASLGGEERVAAIRLAGFSLADANRPEEAEPLLASLCPNPQQCEDFHLLSQLLFCRLELCDWRELDALIARCKAFIAAGEVPLEPFTFQLLPGVTANEQLRLTESFVQRMPLAPVLASPLTNRDPHRRLKIGYLSADFHDHAVMRLLVGVLEHHDRRNHGDSGGFEIHAFSYGPPDNGAMRRRIVAACDVFHDLFALSIDAMARRIADAQIDILIDLTGWTGNTKSALLTWRPAPIQVNWLGYSGSLGDRRFADYLIGDAIATPLADQPNFAEQLMLMPHCCHPADNTRPIGSPRTRADEGLPDEGLVFCCFSRPLKIVPEIFDAWCELLRQTPGSVLWLYAANETATRNLCQEAQARGVDPARLVFAPSKPPEGHLARLQLADLALDTWPFGAHTTASDALWAGVPVLTLMGDTLPSRMTASLLHAAGLPELVTHSLAAYRELAIALAREPERLNALRQRLADNRSTCALFDTEKFTYDLEVLLRAMWRSPSLNQAYASSHLAPPQ